MPGGPIMGHSVRLKHQKYEHTSPAAGNIL